MSRPSAGQARLAFRVPQSGQLDFTPTLSLGCCIWDRNPYNRAKIRAIPRGIRFAIPCRGGGSMDDAVLREQTPAEYFKSLIESALTRQHLRTSELTSYYLVDLLCRFVRPDRRIPFNDDSTEPLAMRLARALDSGGMEQRARLRNLEIGRASCRER